MSIPAAFPSGKNAPAASNAATAAAAAPPSSSSPAAVAHAAAASRESTRGLVTPFECLVCNDMRYWCRGCTRGLRELPAAIGISDAERERIYNRMFAGCDAREVPCIACNKEGFRPPRDLNFMGLEPLRDFWRGFEIHFGEGAGSGGPPPYDEPAMDEEAEAEGGAAQDETKAPETEPRVNYVMVTFPGGALPASFVPECAASMHQILRNAAGLGAQSSLCHGVGLSWPLGPANPALIQCGNELLAGVLIGSLASKFDGKRADRPRARLVQIEATQAMRYWG